MFHCNGWCFPWTIVAPIVLSLMANAGDELKEGIEHQVNIMTAASAPPPVEKVLYRHPAVSEAAVTAMPDEKWGETPCALIDLRTGADAVTEEDIIDFCRDNMARFQAPRKVVFGSLPKTSTGKMRKFELRERAKKL